MPQAFQMVDVFGSADFSGNPLAVVAGADHLDTEGMQRIARWLNLSETAFLFAPTTTEADYRVRIFTLDGELPFAGHPTLGSCHAWLFAGGQARRSDRIVQECGVGLVELRRDGDILAFAAPPTIRSGVPTQDELGEALELLRIGPDQVAGAQWVDNGPGWIAVKLHSAEAVLALEPLRSYPRHVDVGVIGAHRAGAEVAWEIRTFFSDHQGAVIEDPVTGSFNASAAQWLYASGAQSGPYTAAQGTRIGRQGRIHVSRDAQDQVWVGGRTRTLFSGGML